MMKSKKGVLLTLATLVLFILLLGELITYIVLNMGYNQLATSGSSAYASASLLNQINGGSSGFLTTSLNNALSALLTYESTPSLRTYHFVNNTAFALDSLMTNGTIYGTNMLSYMGGATLGNYTTALKRVAGLQGGILNLTNMSITVYQTMPFYLTARLSGLAVLNGTYSTTSYPIYSVANISINGTQSLIGAQNGNPSYVKASAFPQATLIGNTYAISGSTSPFMFAYGTAIFIGGTPSGCSAVPSQFQTSNYILVTSNAINMGSGVCRMAGLVANVVPGVNLKPYLIFPNSIITTNIIGNGTSLLLDGPGLALLDPSPIQTAIQNGYWSASPYTASYLMDSQQTADRGAGPGIFSFGQLGRESAGFSGSTSNIITKNTLNSNTVTVTVWVKPNGPAASGTIFNSLGTNNIGLSFAAGSGLYYPEKLSIGSSSCTLSSNSIGIVYNNWNFVAVSINNGIASAYTGLSGNVTVPVPAAVYSLNSLTLGGTGGFVGNMSNLQVYSSALSPAQIMQIYLNGIDGTPISNKSLVGWYPLNGNATGYSGADNNGTATNIKYYNIPDYTADPLFKSLPNAYNTSPAIGVLNCANPTQCTNASLGHLYLGSRPLSVVNGISYNESEAFNIYNGFQPQGIHFFGSTNAMVQTTGSSYNYNAYTISFWFYPDTLENSRSWMVSSLSGGFAVEATAAGFLTTLCDGKSETTSQITQTGTWSFITTDCSMITSGGASNAVVDFYLNGNFVANTKSTVTSFNSIGTLIIGNASNYRGIITDVQLYNSVLSAGHVQALYLNNTVVGNTPIGYWPLSSTINGLVNQTPDLEGKYPGYLYRYNGIICTNANVVTNTCGASFMQT